MQAIQIDIINADSNLTLWEKSKAYFAPSLDLSENAKWRLGNYDQKKNPYCTEFASGGCYTYNTGDKLNNAILELRWIKNIGTNPNAAAMLSVTAQRFAKDFGRKYAPIRLDRIDGEKVMKAGYALAISTRASLGFWKELLTKGKAKWKYPGDPLAHAMYMTYNNWKYFWHNAWYENVSKWLYNDFEIDLWDVLGNLYLRPLAFIIY